MGKTLVLLLATSGLMFAACSDDTVPVGLDSGKKDSAVKDQTQSADSANKPDGAKTDTGAAKTDTGATSQCAAAGGTCTDQRWVLCAKGQEPIDPDPHQDCANNGWCCVKAPTSTCSDKAPTTNCVAGTACTGCWAAATDTSLTCESGRVCCFDNCE